MMARVVSDKEKSFITEEAKIQTDTIYCPARNRPENLYFINPLALGRIILLQRLNTTLLSHIT